ncbi:glycosyltransferase family 69 protein [Cylindrobasidium torrendii FP15055 ss-10]|uniref:Glycosyltransferase family 69 protein n=1 Tax=Cylindrobasidium torrendii FP15055 ss-10 TaxID=1314674 RepID=A0A0D7BCM4_9AGAR|nr:glycosyltransferase family 69 protein [Cylindrobasidium torrendii FP15055 ss-10]
MARSAIRLTWALQVAFTIVKHISPWALPGVLFAVIYNQIYLYWLSWVGWGVWQPAWPAGRTRLVYLMVTIPVWAAVMAALQIGYPLLQRLWSSRHRVQPDYEAINLDMDESRPNARNLRRKYLQHRSYITVLVYLSIFFCGMFVWTTYEQPNDVRYREDVLAAIKDPRPEGHGNGEKIFIAAMFFNNERVLPYWTEEMTKVIKYLGTDNVFVSIVESNSGDKTPDLLKEWEARLNEMHVKSRVLIHDTSVERPPSMDTATPRIKFLADVRNKVMEPLVQMGGFDRVLFSNDVFIEAESVVELLKTKDGKYDMACGLDLSYWGMYDAWVVRDRLGGIVSSLWPYFLEQAGMQAVMKDEPAPVLTCWNGIISVTAEPFMPIHLRKPGRLSTNPLSTPLPSSHPSYGQSALMTPANTPPLAFRHSIEGKECFSSESFLLPYDMRRQFELNEIYLNPRVINSYEWSFYVWYKYVLRHWMVKWWIENVEAGSMMHLARMIIGDSAKVWRWDGGECQPWF